MAGREARTGSDLLFPASLAAWVPEARQLIRGRRVSSRWSHALGRSVEAIVKAIGCRRETLCFVVVWSAPSHKKVATLHAGNQSNNGIDITITHRTQAISDRLSGDHST